MSNNFSSTTPLRDQPMTVQQALDAARAIGIEPLDAQLLLLFALGRSSRERAWLLAHDTDPILKDVQNNFMALAQRRAIGVPLAYLTGEKEFYGLSFTVDRRVLVPRPETELLIEWALELLAGLVKTDSNVPARVLDLGTGSGILAITLKHLLPELNVTATDISSDALTVATLNASDLLPPTSTVKQLQGRWFEPLSEKNNAEPFNLIVSNPPYIAQGDEHLCALSHEPHCALVSGVDGLDDIRLIVTQAPKYLAHGAWLLLEHGYNQGQAVQELLQTAGFHDVQTRKDLAGLDRATGGCWLST